MEEILIRKMQPEDWPQVEEIYIQGIETKNATFEKEVPTYKLWDEIHHPIARLVAVENGSVLAWAALSPISSRCIYEGVAEVSVYVHKDFYRKKLGEKLLQQLIPLSEELNFWTLYSSIFPENIGSVLLHKKMGFREIGFREKIGKLDGEWRDTVIFERRSQKII